MDPKLLITPINLKAGTDEYIKKLDEAIAERDSIKKAFEALIEYRDKLLTEIENLKGELDTALNDLEAARQTIRELQSINAEYAWSNGEQAKLAAELLKLKADNKSLNNANIKALMENSILKDLLRDTIVDFAEIMREA